MERNKNFVLYRIWYGDALVYVGRTKQPLQTRIRGHVFSKPMHRTLDIEHITRIDYAQMKSEADMNVYEVYYISLWHPPLNVDDKPLDNLIDAVLPPLEWKPFHTKLWGKWKSQIEGERESWSEKIRRIHEINEQRPIIRALHRQGEITEYEMRQKLNALDDEYAAILEELHS